ncbi:YhgE/Pip domain-containing protein [Nocardia sp. NPDC127526]|uniref:YhgE/Pip domain-containing protein n=1 Tax=Nocardia sp. NPDC127526 TaxID=3345393 RepID=UPI0036344677
MFGKRSRWALFVLLLAAAVAAGAVALLRLSPAPEGVALINADTGPIGERVVKALQDSGTREWDVVDEASTADYAAIITLPEDLSTSVSSLATDKPQRAQVTVTTHDRADADTVNDAVNEVTKQISAAGLDSFFAAMNSARGQVSQVAFTSQLLSAGVQAAADGAGQFSGGADQLLSFLEQAKVGAAQMTSAIAQLNTTVAAATTQANQLADALEATGVTVGQITGATTALSDGINTVVPLLQALPFAGDPQLASIIQQMQSLQTIANQAGGQLSGVGQITGTEVTADTTISQLLRDAATRLSDAGAQLSQGAQLAEQIPQIADQGSTQLLTAMQALTTGVTQLQAVTNTLGTQANQALNSLPARSVPQQSLISSMLADPVEIVRK